MGSGHKKGLRIFELGRCTVADQEAEMLFGHVIFASLRKFTEFHSQKIQAWKNTSYYMLVYYHGEDLVRTQAALKGSYVRTVPK